MNTQEWKKKIKKTLVGSFLAKKYHHYQISRPKISYSQIGEDLIIDHFLNHRKHGFYVDIGAYDPVHLSNTHLFYKRGWEGIQIEPDYTRSQRFQKKRPRSLTLNIGIGELEQVSPFYVFKEGALSTFSKEAADNNMQEGHEMLETREVPIKKLVTIFDHHVKNKKIDLLSIDTEGYDLEILKTNNWEKYRPTFVIVETVEYGREGSDKKLNDVYDSFMKEKGYKKFADTFLNTIYKDLRS